MSTIDINKAGNVEENKTPDKKQIEAEEKEVMLKVENENIEVSDDTKADPEGPVKAALSGEVTEQGREVKPKFIPIGAIKMPGFFTRNAEKSKDDEAAIEKDADNEKNGDEGPKIKRNRLQFLHTCPFTQFLHRPQHENDESTGDSRRIGPFNLKYPKVFQRRTANNEVTLASIETLEEKSDTTTEEPETVMLNVPSQEKEEESKVATKLPLKERIRQKKFIIDDILVCALVLLVLLVVIIGIVIGARAGPPKKRPLRLGKYFTTLTSCGPIEGILDEGVYKFFNIPYAVPPVEEKRFAYAQPLNNISLCWNGTRNAHKPGPRCIQFLENGTIIGEEDCLTLDVVTPHVRYDWAVPVVVMIGANTLAGGISLPPPSALYARTQEVVFVRPNFRLGPFGFLALDILSKSTYPEISGNYGLSDLLVALQWVRHNIKHFGGNINSVTLFGHRAGATLTALLTTSPRAYRLYSGVWLSSPSGIYPSEPLEQSQKNNELFLQRINCADINCLRNVTALEILTATPDIWLGSTVGLLPVKDELKYSWLVFDGDILRQHAVKAWEEQRVTLTKKNKPKLKPMVFGTTQHSAHSDLLQMKKLNWTSEIVEKMVNESIIGEKNLTQSVFKEFNKTYEGLVSLISSIRTVCPLLSVARLRLSVPMYVVIGAGAGGGAIGSGMAGINADVEAILGTFDSQGPEQRRYITAMQQWFYFFVWHGFLPDRHNKMFYVGQDWLVTKDLPGCELLILQDVVPDYAHID